MTIQLACCGRDVCYLMQYVESRNGGRPSIRVDRLSYNQSLFDKLITQFEPYRMAASAAESGMTSLLATDGPSPADVRGMQDALNGTLTRARELDMRRL